MASFLHGGLCSILVLFLASGALCKKGGRQSELDLSEVVNPDREAPDADHTGEINTGEDFVEGDMKVPGGKKGAESNRNAARDPNKLWPQGIVPYILDRSAQSAAVRKVVQEAIAEYNQHTCVKFQPRQREPDYVKITTQHVGCWSALGRNGDEQELNLGQNCVWKGTTIHEMMHAIGFEHEQKRGDRDNYISINFSNIDEDKRFNFDKLKASEENNQRFGYDFSSIMHYGQYAFAINRRTPTITTRDPRNQNKIGQRAGFSKQDIEEVNRLYKCSGKRSGIQGVNGCLDKHQDYCENILGLKGNANPNCNAKTAAYCKVSCHKCDPGDGRGKGTGGSGGGGSTNRVTNNCKDKNTDYCSNTLKMSNGPNHHCNTPHIKDYCKKSCQAC